MTVTASTPVKAKRRGDRAWSTIFIFGPATKVARGGTRTSARVSNDHLQAQERYFNWEIYQDLEERWIQGY